MKKVLTFFFSFLLGIAFLVGLFNYFLDWQLFNEEFGQIVYWEWLLVLGMAILPFLVAILRWQTILKRLGISIPYKDLFVYQSSGYAVNYLVPVAALWADIFKAGVVGKKNLSKGAASVLIDRVFSTIFGIFFITSGVVLFFTQIGGAWVNFIYVYVIAISFLIFSLSILFLFLFRPEAFKKIGLLRVLLNSFSKEESLIKEAGEEAVKFFNNVERSFLVKLSLLTILNIFLLAGASFVMVTFLGHHIPVSHFWSIYGVTTASLETPISADLGSHDLTSALAFQALGVGREAGTVYAFVFRGGKLFISSLGLISLARLTIFNGKKKQHLS